MGIKFSVNLFLVCSLISLSSCGRGKTSSESDSQGENGTVASSQPDTSPSASGGDKGETPLLSSSSDPATKPADPENKPQEPVKTAVSFKKMEIILSESFKPLSKQIAHSGLLKGQSDAFAFYIQYWLDVFNLYKKGEEAPPNPRLVQTYETAVRILCPDLTKCEGGLNLKKVDKFVIDKLISVLSLSSLYLFFDKEKAGTTLAFTQGFFSPPDSLTVRQNSSPEKWEERPSIKMVQGIVREIARRNIKDIIINLPIIIPSQQDVMDFLPFFYLGEVMKKQEIDLHVIGYCGSYCVNYLLPAAKTVYVEPFYGYVATRGSFNGLADNVIGGRELPEFLEDWKRELDKSLASEEERKRFIVKRIQKLIQIWNSFNIVSPVKMTFSHFIFKTFSNGDFYAEGTGEAFVAEQEKFVNGTGKQSFDQLTEEEMMNFVTDLPPELSDNLFSGIYKFTEKEAKEYFNNLQSSASEESDYYDKIKIESLKFKSYAFIDFLSIPARLVWQPTYEEFFPFLPRSYYHILEREKPYWVAPSTELLQELGLDVRGENNVERLFDIIERQKETGKLLYIDSKGMKKCDFFAETTSFTQQDTLDKCLSL